MNGQKKASSFSLAISESMLQMILGMQSFGEVFVPATIQSIN